jgi:hypothetical protein
MYQVSVHCRSALHDRYLQSIFRSDAFPPRPFWIWCDTDETWRRTELTQAVNANISETTESGTKRIFRTVYTINMLAEVPQDRILDSWTYKVLRTLIPVTALEDFDSYYDNVLNGVTDPVGTMTTSERVAEGEYSHVTHEGREVLALTGGTTTLLTYGEGPEPGQKLWGDDLNAYLLSLEARIASNEERMAALEDRPEYIYSSAPWTFKKDLPPATGSGNQSQVRLDNLDPTLVTMIDFRRIDSDGADRTPWFQALSNRAIIRISDWDVSTVSHQFKVLGSADFPDATNAHVPVTWDQGEGDLPNAKVNVGFVVVLTSL